MLTSTLNATLYSVQLAVGPNGERYVKAFVGQPADLADESTKGISLMSLSCEPEVFDQVNIKDYPASVEIDTQLIRGGQNKMKQHVVAIRSSVKPK